MRLGFALTLAVAITPANSLAATKPDVLDGAFRDVQMVIGSRTALALSGGAMRLAAVDPILAGMIVARQDASKALAKADSDRILARTALPVDQVAIDQTIALAAAARAAYTAADTALAKRSPGYAQLTGIAPLSIVEAQALLSHDEAIVLIHSTAEATYTFGITSTTADWRRSTIGRAAVASTVNTLRTALDPSNAAVIVDVVGADAPIAAFPRQKAFTLYTQIWAPIEPILHSAKTVYVVADGALGGLPLAVLPTLQPTGKDSDVKALHRTQWLIRSHALVTLPSVGSLRALRSIGLVHNSTQPFAGFGDPSLNGSADKATPRSFVLVRGNTSGDIASQLRGFPQLPGSRLELEALAATLGADHTSIVTGAAATEKAVEAASLDNVSVVAFATHGLLAGEISPTAEPALVFTPPIQTNGNDDGLLTASEAASLHLHADWVILSACNTAASDGSAGGEGLSGLARGFFSAGARAVLASHWQVRDDAVQALTVGTIAHWKAAPSLGRAAALQAAMLAMIENRQHPDYANPTLWAPFVVAGDGR